MAAGAAPGSLRISEYRVEALIFDNPYHKERIMRTQNILLVSLLAMLCGCQPKAPAPQATAPAAAQSPAAPAPTMQPAASETAAVPTQQPPAAAEKPRRSTVAKEPAQTAAVPAAGAPVAKAEQPAKIEPAEAKPAAKPEPVVSEAEAMQLAKKNNCLACHAVDRKVVGPAWKDVAAKYRGDAEAETRLTNKIAKGGSGVWGVMVMPPSPQVSEADRRTLARFVLSLK